MGFSRETAPCAPSTWQGWHREPATPRGTLPPWVQAHVMCHCAWGEEHLVLQGLLWKAAPAGQGDALLHQLRKHHPGQHLFIRYFKWEPEKKRGRGEKGRKKNQVHFCSCLFTKYISIFTYKKAFFFFPLQDNSLISPFFCVCENSLVYGLRLFLSLLLNGHGLLNFQTTSPPSICLFTPIYTLLIFNRSE